MALSLIFDLSIALICLISIIRNAIRGFIRSFVSMTKSVLAVFLAYLFNAPLARGFSSWIFSDLSRGWVRNLMVSTTYKDDGYALYEIFDGIPNWFTRVSISQGIDPETVEHYFVEQNHASEALVDELSVTLGDALSMLISTVISFLLIFIVLEIVFVFLGKLLYRLADVPIWKTANWVFGALIGAVISAVMAWLISMLIVYVFSFGSNYYPNVFDYKVIEDTIIVEFFGNNNLFEIVKGWFV